MEKINEIPEIKEGGILNRKLTTSADYGGAARALVTLLYKMER